MKDEPDWRETHDLVWHIGCWGCAHHWSAGGGSGCHLDRSMPSATDQGLICEQRNPRHWAPSNAERQKREAFARRTISYPPWTNGKRKAALSGKHYLEPDESQTEHDPSSEEGTL